MGADVEYDGAYQGIMGTIGATLTEPATNLRVLLKAMGTAIAAKGSSASVALKAPIDSPAFTTIVNIPQATTVGAPAYVKGAMYFDTTLNKLRIGGASGWETVTSS